jgi:hypothetical protein
MNVRTQINLDSATQQRAHAKAAELGISFAEYVRRLVANDLRPLNSKEDISIVFDLVDEGPRTNIARDKDKMIAEAVWQEHLRKTGPKQRTRAKLKISRR